MISGTYAARGERKYGRVAVDGDIRVSHAVRSTVARACDIGCGGMSFFSGLELAEGDVVDLEFELPHCSAPFKVSAAVRNRNGLRYGVEFQQLTSDEFGEIARVTAILSYSQV